MAVNADTPWLDAPSTGAIRKAARQRARLPISSRRQEGQVRPQSQSDGADVNGDRPVPVHRADLARHLEAGGAGLRLRQLRRRRSRARLPAATWWRIRACAPEDPCNCAQEPDRQRADGRRVHPAEHRCVGEAARPRAERSRALHRALFRALPAPPRRFHSRKAIPKRQCGRNLSGGGARQSADLLRQAGQRAQHRRRLRGTGAPLSSRARRAARARDRSRAKGRAAESRRSGRDQPVRALARGDPGRAGERSEQPARQLL